MKARCPGSLARFDRPQGPILHAVPSKSIRAGLGAVWVGGRDPGQRSNVPGGVPLARQLIPVMRNAGLFTSPATRSSFSRGLPVVCSGRARQLMAGACSTQNSGTALLGRRTDQQWRKWETRNTKGGDRNSRSGSGSGPRISGGTRSARARRRWRGPRRCRARPPPGCARTGRCPLCGQQPF